MILNTNLKIDSASGGYSSSRKACNLLFKNYPKVDIISDPMSSNCAI
jgi:hypothetical protein